MEATVSTLPNGVVDLIDRGYGFYYTSASALAKAVTTDNVPMLWNPSDSGVNLKILKVKIGAISGTIILAHHAYAWLIAGAQVGTAQPIVSATFVSAVNAKFGSGRASRVKFCPTTCSITTGPTYWMPSGISAGGAAAAGPLYKLIDDVDGAIIIPPGIAFFPFISNGAMALTAAVTVLGLEIPISEPVL